jgi:hypothetical protein
MQAYPQVDLSNLLNSANFAPTQNVQQAAQAILAAPDKKKKKAPTAAETRTNKIKNVLTGKDVFGQDYVDLLFDMELDELQQASNVVRHNEGWVQ